MVKGIINKINYLLSGNVTLCQFYPTNIGVKLENLHPKQIIDLRGTQHTYIYEYRYEYTTYRGNDRVGVKYLLINQMCGDMKELDNKFNDYVLQQNNTNDYRAISNVKILERKIVSIITSR